MKTKTIRDIIQHEDFCTHDSPVKFCNCGRDKKIRAIKLMVYKALNQTVLFTVTKKKVVDYLFRGEKI